MDSIYLLKSKYIIQTVMKYYYSASVHITRNRTLVHCFVSKHWESHSTLFSAFFVRLPHQCRGVGFHDISWNDRTAETSHRSSHERLRCEKHSGQTSHSKLQQLLIFSGYNLLLFSCDNQEAERPANIQNKGQSGAGISQ